MNDKLDKLLSSNCTQLDDEITALNLSEIEDLRQAVPHWQYCANENLLEQTFWFENYADTIKFMNVVAEVAEKHNHHPDMLVSFKRCKVKYSTHSLDGISVKDFICAAHIDAHIPSDLTASSE